MYNVCLFVYKLYFLALLATFSEERVAKEDSSEGPSMCHNVAMVYNKTGKDTFDWIQAHKSTDINTTSSKFVFNATIAKIAQKATTFYHSNFSTMFMGEFDQDQVNELNQLPGVDYTEKWYAR